MSDVAFDILFSPSRYRGRVVTKKNAFTGAVQEFRVCEPLTNAEEATVSKLLSSRSAAPPDEFGCYQVRVADGGEAEVFATMPSDGCTVTLRGLTPALLDFLMELLRAADWVMTPIQEEAIAMAASPESVQSPPPDLPRVVVCGTGQELGVLLCEGVAAWQRYRDQVSRSPA